MKKGSQIYAYSRYVAFGLAASGGLICAACISAHPSANCAAMARVYLVGIQSFGEAGFCGVAILGAIEISSREGRREHRTDSIFAASLMTLGALGLLIGLIISITSLPEAVGICWQTKP
jgi:hypothetical protein